MIQVHVCIYYGHLNVGMVAKWVALLPKKQESPGFGLQGLRVGHAQPSQNLM